MTSPHAQHPYPTRTAPNASRSVRAALGYAPTPTTSRHWGHPWHRPAPASRIALRRLADWPSIGRAVLVALALAGAYATGVGAGQRIERTAAASAPTDSRYVAVYRGRITSARTALDQAQVALSMGDTQGAMRVLDTLAAIVGSMDCHTDTECEATDREADRIEDEQRDQHAQPLPPTAPRRMADKEV